LIIYSDLVEEELLKYFDDIHIKEIISIIPKQLLIKIETKAKQLEEAIKISKKLRIPVKDALHAILARDNDTILVTRDKHFYELAKQVTIKKPEDLL